MSRYVHDTITLFGGGNYDPYSATACQLISSTWPAVKGCHAKDRVLADVFLPLSSLRLLIPALRLVSSAMWQVSQRRDVMDYEKLHEFVTLVTETVPDLLDTKQRAKLLLRLRTRMILDFCAAEQTSDIHLIQPHLDRILTLGRTGSGNAEMDAEEAIFLELVQTLLKNTAEREHFYQEVFPTEYGVNYNKDMQLLVWEFLSRLEKLLPVPDLGQILNRHMLIHNGQWPSYCEKSFTQLAGLTRHERIHTEERPYLCTVCQKTFLTHRELVRHQRSNSYNRLYPCPRCPKSFKTKRAQSEYLNTCSITSGELLLHRRIHTGERPYPCSYCERHFI